MIELLIYLYAGVATGGLFACGYKGHSFFTAMMMASLWPAVLVYCVGAAVGKLIASRRVES